MTDGDDRMNSIDREIVVPWMNSLSSKLCTEAAIVFCVASVAVLVVLRTAASATFLSLLAVVCVTVFVSLLAWEILSQESVVHTKGRLVVVSMRICSLPFPWRTYDSTRGGMSVKNTVCFCRCNRVSLYYKDTGVGESSLVTICWTSVPHASRMQKVLTEMASAAKRSHGGELV